MKQNVIAWKSFGQLTKDRHIASKLIHGLMPENQFKLFKRYSGFLILKGEGSYKDWKGQTHPLKAGDFVQHLPHKFHHIIRKKSQEWVQSSINLDEKTFLEMIEYGIIDPNTPVYQLNSNLKIEKDIEEFRSFLQKSSEDKIPQALIMAQNILLKIRNHKQTTNPKQSMILAAKDLLGSDFNQEPNLEDFANDHHISYHHFRRLFKNETGQSPGLFRTQKKMEKAREILIETNDSIQNISQRLGYSELFAFSKQFKKSFTQSPSQYRKSTREEE